MRLMLCVLLCAGQAWAATVIAESKITGPSGRLATGTITITATAAFAAASGARVEIVPVVVAVVNGRMSVALEPNDTGMPAGTQYSIVWQLNGARPRTERWTVPTSVLTLRLGDVATAAVTAAETVSLGQITQGGASAGQVPVWSGTTWAPGTVTSGVSSVYKRTGAVVATTGDYTAAQVGAEPTITAGTTGQYWRGDKSWQDMPSSMVYPGAGVASSTGTAWGTSYAVGTGASNLVQLNGSAQLPAVSAALLTNFPTFNQSTSGNAGSATALAANGANCTGGQVAAGVDAAGAAEGCTSNVPGSAGTITGALGLANTPLTARGDLLIATTGTPILGKVAKGTQYQTFQGGASDPGYDALHLDQATAVTGILPIGNLPAQVPACTKYTVTTSGANWTVNGTTNDAVAAALTQTITIGTNAIPAGGEITSLRIKHSTAFSGTSITAMTVSLGDGTTTNIYAPEFNVFAAVANTTLWPDGGAMATTSAQHSLTATFTSVGANLTAIAAGSVDVWACVRTLP